MVTESYRKLPGLWRPVDIRKNSKQTRDPATANIIIVMGFSQDFILSGAAIAVSKTAVAPLDRVKYLLQTQNELTKKGRLDSPYKGVIDCSKRILRTEGLYHAWRGNLPNLLKFFPTQAFNFALKDRIKAFLRTSKDASITAKFAANIASGGLAGGLSLMFVYPLEYARTRLVTDIKSRGGERQFSGLIDVYVKTLKSDGVQGLYRGFTISVLGVFLYRGLYFGLYDTLKPPVLGPDPALTLSFLLGWAVSFTAGLLCYPLGTVRSRMMMRSCEPVKYRGSLDCLTQITKTEGWRSLMRGAGVNIVRGLAGTAVLIGCDNLKKNPLVRWILG